MGLVHGGIPGLCDGVCAEEGTANGRSDAGTGANTCP